MIIRLYKSFKLCQSLRSTQSSPKTGATDTALPVWQSFLATEQPNKANNTTNSNISY